MPLHYGQLLLALLSAEAVCAAETAEKSAAAVAAELANPNASLGFLTFPIDYVSYDGDAPEAGSQTAWKLNFQPSLPYSLNESTNLFFRPLVPVFIDQPVPILGGDAIVPDEPEFGTQEFGSTGTQLGDISFDVAIGKTLDSGLVVVGGVVGTLPTATDDRVGLDQYLIGPEFLLGKGGRWGFVGLLVNHQWSVAGEDDYDTSLTGGQYFYTINLKNAWQIQAQPTFSYNHNGTAGNRWTLPVGIGVSKTTIIGKTPWKFGLQYWHYVESPKDFGAEYQIRFVISPVVNLPW